MKKSNRNEVHVIGQLGRLRPDEHDAIIVQATKVGHDFLVKFIRVNGYNPIDVLAGVLWAVIGIGRKVGFDEETALGLVRDCYKRHLEQEAIDSAAARRRTR